MCMHDMGKVAHMCHSVVCGGERTPPWNLFSYLYMDCKDRNLVKRFAQHMSGSSHPSMKTPK